MSSSRWASLNKLIKQIEQHLPVSSNHQEAILEAQHTIQTTIVPQIHTIMNDINKQDLMALLGNELVFSKIVRAAPASSSSQTPNKVHFLTLLNTPNTELTVFAVPPGGILPLHDHPDMSVVCKVVEGKLNRYAVDWVDHDDKSKNRQKYYNTLRDQKKNGGEVVCVSQDVLVEGTTTVTSTAPPSSSSAMLIESNKNRGGVAHELWSEPDAEIGAVFIDFFTPKYFGEVKIDETNNNSSSFTRDCTYFELLESNKSNNNKTRRNIRDQKVGDVAFCSPLDKEPDVEMKDMFSEMMVLRQAAHNYQQQQEQKNKKDE